MHPAPSIIFFTVFSGLGFGLMIFLGLGMPGLAVSGGFTSFIFFFIAYALAVGGLISSTLHLGNPQRALKAFSQWRSSWLSREGCLAVATLVVMGIYAMGIIFLGQRWGLLGIIGSLLSLATVAATSMIYTQIKTVPRWAHWTTPTLFIAYSITGGALLAGQTLLVTFMLLILALLQLAAWIMGDKQFKEAGSTIETATGLGHMGKVRMFEAPHSSKNYLMKEMVHEIGRKHSKTLRVIGIMFLALIPWVLLTMAGANHFLIAVAILFHVAGALAIRWLFFAEAEHTVGLFYGKR